jgi:beta-lactamase class A
VEDNKAYEAGLNNECNARSVLAAIVACRESQFFSAETRRRMMAILESQELDSMISNGIPAGSGAVVGHKTGSISSVEHDAGIVRLANGKAYGIVILTWNFGEQRSGAVETGTAISAMVFRYFSGE